MRKPLKTMVGLERFETPTHGLGSAYRRINVIERRGPRPEEGQLDASGATVQRTADHPP